MTTKEKIETLRANIRKNVKLDRGGGEEIEAYIIRVNGEDEDVICEFMDIMEGVERTLSVSAIENIKVH